MIRGGHVTVRLFYRTQRELAIAVNDLIDSYWKEQIDEQQLIQSIKNIHQNNPGKLLKGNQFTTIVQQQSGKRRLQVVERILEI